MIPEILITAFILGFIDGAAPGAVFAIMAGNLIKGGVKIGIKTFLWASFFDISKAAIIILFLLGFSLPELFFHWLGIFGGALLLYFSKHLFQVHKITKNEVVFPIKKFAAIHYANPAGYLAWGLIYLPLIVRAKTEIAFGGFYFFGLLELGWMIGTLGMLMAVYFAVSFLKNEKIIHYIFQFLGLVLVFFGVKMIYDSLVLLHFI